MVQIACNSLQANIGRGARVKMREMEREMNVRTCKEREGMRGGGEREREREREYFRSPFVLIGFPTVSRNPAPVSSRRRRQFPMKTLTSLSSASYPVCLARSVPTLLSSFLDHTFPIS